MNQLEFKYGELDGWIVDAHRIQLTDGFYEFYRSKTDKHPALYAPRGDKLYFFGYKNERS